MLAWWGRIVVRGRWLVLVAATGIVLLGASWGADAFSAMSPGGFDDPASESTRARQRIVEEVGRLDVDIVALYSSADMTVDDVRFRAAVQAVVSRVRQRPEVERVLSCYDRLQPPGTGTALVSGDRHATYVAVALRRAGSDEQFEAVVPDLRAPGLTTQIGGPTAILTGVTAQINEDLERAEMLSMPVLLVLLILIFRGVVAAVLPLLIGGLAILGSLIGLRLLTYATDVSIFTTNIMTLLGLGMAIDYALFVVGRFREELRQGREVPDAVVRTVTTAGRTVLVSGLTVALALASLLVFPQMFLRSMGFGGMAAVLVTMLAALTVLPALLAVLGMRLLAWRTYLPRHARHDQDTGSAVWARIAEAVMRRPVPVVVGTVVVLGLLTMPFLRARFSDADELVLPPGTQSRVVSERIDAEFPAGGDDRLLVLVSGVDRTAAAVFAREIATLPDVKGAVVIAGRGDSSVISIAYNGETGGPVARGIVVSVRALARPPGADVLVGGPGAETEDMLASLGDHLPVMALLITVSTFVLLFGAFGSLLLPVKAVLMNAVSIGASFGVVVWVFQDGHFADLLGFTPTGDLGSSQLILMFAILFGLSTDYEVFLLSRVREEWQRTGDNTAAVATGLQRTGGVITSAALLLAVVVGGFAVGGISFVKMLGVGMITAIVVDATIVRALLVPATMRLLGGANWWPGRRRAVIGTRW